MSQPVRRILLECTNTRASDLNTGIQRVVRNVVREAGKLGREMGVQCEPIVIENGEFYKARDPLFRPLLAKAHRFLRHVQDRFSHVHQRGAVATPVRKLLYPKSLVRRLVDKTAPMRTRKVRFREGDILLMLDASWHLPAWPAIRRVQQLGCPVGCVYYDLIPLKHPEFCVGGHLVPLYRKWLDNAVEQLDFYIAISKTVSRGLEEYARSSGRRADVRSERFESFRLGADFSRSTPAGPTRPELQRLFSGRQNRPPWLCVGTVEPRKNHGYLLDAFEQVWQHDVEASLCIVGGVGWKCEEVVTRVRQHPRYGTSLFMFNDASDAELHFCYERAKAIVFPSIVEGFGLPIVEALRFGLPVLASDTPIHREVGEEYCSYFDLDDASSLASRILHIERQGFPPSAKTHHDYPFATWTDSSRELLTKCLQLSDAVMQEAGNDSAGERLLPAAA